MVRCESVSLKSLRAFGFPISHFTTDEEEDVENPEEQDEHGNLRGLIDDNDDEEGEGEEEAEKSNSGGGSDSEEEVKHWRKKRSKFTGC